ncbi:type VI secretion system protein ImpF [Sinobacterium caligoides]|uniref:Type VI secretion system protein ImpF n=1 Tax=Sinobacterium caligoides TaxID=933926 RepID=A0A3N2DJQ8_9GAMM|nr:type VI secretion system baseplate subunit TssE [Sinobacterium caligoides]ROS00044.1 type VI secretion system protein ImpF [Sinobacterium caligoides]
MNNHKKLVSPILTRLTAGSENKKNSQVVLQELKEGVRFDLECLFNARYRCFSADSKYQHLEDSLLNYGLPDLSTINLSTQVARVKFCRQIEETITKFDPRIKSARVSASDNIDHDDPSIRFRVEARLFTNPAPETVIFDSSLNPVTQLIAVSEVYNDR